MKTLIAGYGEIGHALEKVLKKYYDVEVIDINQKCQSNKFDIMHVCFPYSSSFENDVKQLIEQYKPLHCVVHSTVPPGTCRKLSVLHSPVRGRHPYLEESILVFVKMIGGEKSEEVAEYFRRAGMKVLLFRKQETTELAKILDTTYYGICIEFAKESERLCKEYDVPFSEAYILANQTYNQGYSELGNDEFIRPILQPIQRKIGGHCVLQNAELLKNSIFAKILKILNSDKRSNKE